ncbi:DUF1902 domain-containing protein [Haematobacter sp.]|uniref:DUF1902 domain-containing protein n=1 Tax=Haematobacter sp. TaxID=2953762 RepID=UPI0028AE6DD4|nr:DUF1902 domain-containing protein [Haematobacter sp.]
MQERSITVHADWDSEAGVWVATTNDICGLAVEASNLEALRERVMGALLDLIELNGFQANGAEIPVHLVTEDTIKVSCAA